LGRLVGVGGVADLTVERDDIGAALAEREQRIAVRLPGRDLVADLVTRQLQRSDVETTRLESLRLVDVDDDVPLAAELGDRSLGIVEGFSVPALLVLDRLDALSLDRAGDDDRRATARR